MASSTMSTANPCATSQQQIVSSTELPCLAIDLVKTQLPSSSSNAATTTLVDQVVEQLRATKRSLQSNTSSSGSATSLAMPASPNKRDLSSSDNNDGSDNENPSSKKQRIVSSTDLHQQQQQQPSKRVSFSSAPQSVVEVALVSDTDKHRTWYKSEDYSQFVCSAHLDAQRLRNAAECATSSEALYLFIQSANLSPRGLEKVLQYTSSSSDEEEESSSDDSSEDETTLDASSSSGTSTRCMNTSRRGCGYPMDSHSRKVKLLKSQHRAMILSMHHKHKNINSNSIGNSADHYEHQEQLRQFSEHSSRWAVETALKLGHIDAQGLF